MKEKILKEYNSREKTKGDIQYFTLGICDDGKFDFHELIDILSSVYDKISKEENFISFCVSPMADPYPTVFFKEIRIMLGQEPIEFVTPTIEKEGEEIKDYSNSKFTKFKKLILIDIKWRTTDET